MGKRILGRIPLPRQKGGAQGTKKGQKGYNRKREKAHLQKEAFHIGGQAYQKNW